MVVVIVMVVVDVNMDVVARSWESVTMDDVAEHFVVRDVETSAITCAWPDEKHLATGAAVAVAKGVVLTCGGQSVAQKRQLIRRRRATRCLSISTTPMRAAVP